MQPAWHRNVRREDAQPNEGSSRVHLSAAPTIKSSTSQLDDVNGRKDRSSVTPRPLVPVKLPSKRPIPFGVLPARVTPTARGAAGGAEQNGAKRIKLETPALAGRAVVPAYAPTARPAPSQPPQQLARAAASANRQPATVPARSLPPSVAPAARHPSGVSARPHPSPAPAGLPPRAATLTRGPPTDPRASQGVPPTEPRAERLAREREEYEAKRRAAKGKGRIVEAVHYSPPPAEDLNGYSRDAKMRPASTKPASHIRFGGTSDEAEPIYRGRAAHAAGRSDHRSGYERTSAPFAANGIARGTPAPTPYLQRAPTKSAKLSRAAERSAAAVQDELIPLPEIIMRNLPRGGTKSYCLRVLDQVGAPHDSISYYRDRRSVHVQVASPEVARDLATALSCLHVEGRSVVATQAYVLQSQLEKRARRAERRAAAARDRQPLSERAPSARAHSPASTRSPTITRNGMRSRQSSSHSHFHRPPSPERRRHTLSFACDEGVPWHQQTTEREVRIALAEASRDGFMVDRHYREGLELVMEGHQKRIKTEVDTSPPMTVGTSADMVEEDLLPPVADDEPAYSPAPASPIELLQPKSPEPENESTPAPAAGPALSSQYAEVEFPMGVYDTVSPSRAMLAEIRAFLKNFLQLFDESRGSLVDYYTAHATFSFSVHGRLPDFPYSLAQQGRNLQARKKGTVATTPYSIVNMMRKLPAVQHDFSEDFTFDHWPLYDDDPLSPLVCTVNGQWEEFATSQVRSFSRTLILLPVKGSNAILPGVGFQIQSDILIIRPHGQLLPILPQREATLPLPSAAEAALDGMPIDLDDIDGVPIATELDYKPFIATPTEEDKQISEEFGGSSVEDETHVISDDEVEPTVARSVISLSSDDAEAEEMVNMPPKDEVPVIDLLGTDDEEEETDEAIIASVAATTMHDSQESEVSASSSESSEEDEVAGLASDDEAAEEGPHFEGSRVAFFTPPVTAKTVRQRKTKMRAFFDCGSRYLAVAKTADILAWSKNGKRDKVETFHAAPPGQDVHCATFSRFGSSLFLGHQTSKGSEAPQLSYLRPRERRYHLLTDRPHADGVSALCVLPSATPNSLTIATGGWDHSVKLWQLDVEEGADSAISIDSLPHLHRSVVQGLTWSDGQQALISGGADARIYAWDPASLQQKASIKWKEQSRVSQLQSCPGQQHVLLVTLSSSEDQLRLYDLRDCSPIARFGFRSPEMLNLTAFARGAFSPKGHLFALPAEDRIRVWDLRNLAQPTHLVASPSPGGVHACFESDLELTILESSTFAYHRIVL